MFNNKYIYGAIAALVLLLGLSFCTPAFAQNDCYTPPEVKTEMLKQGYSQYKILTEEEMVVVRDNLKKRNPEGDFSFTLVELYIHASYPDNYFIAIYDYPDDENGKEIEGDKRNCMWNFFPTPKADVEQLLIKAPV